MSTDYAEYGVADLGVAGMMVAGWHSGELIALVGQYITPAVADIGVAGMMVAGLDDSSASYYNLQKGSLSITDQHQDVSTASFSIKCPIDERPRQGDPAIIAIGTLEDPIFAGYIDDVDEGKASGDKFIYACNARALARDLEKRIISAYDAAEFGLPIVWQNMYAGDILTSLLAAYTPHFFDGGHIEQGVFINEISLLGKTLLDACHELATRSNYVFHIAPDREIHFQRRETQSAEWQLDDKERFSGLKIKELSSQIKNRIAVTYSELQEQTETFSGDGDTTVFPLARVPYEVSSLTVNGSPVTYGTRYAENNSDNDCSVNYNEGEIHIQALDTPEEGDEVTIAYTAKIPALLVVNHAESQAERRDREGGDGIYDFEIPAENDIFSQADAQARADAELEQYAFPQITASYTRTDRLYEFQDTRLQVGQQQTITTRDRNAVLTIERVTISIAIPQQGHRLTFSQQVELGPVSKGLESVFKDLQDSPSTTIPEITTTREV